MVENEVVTLEGRKILQLYTQRGNFVNDPCQVRQTHQIRRVVVFFQKQQQKFHATFVGDTRRQANSTKDLRYALEQSSTGTLRISSTLLSWKAH